MQASRTATATAGTVTDGFDEAGLDWLLKWGADLGFVARVDLSIVVKIIIGREKESNERQRHFN